MDMINELIHALWQQDYETLANPSLVWTIYGILFVILFLENGLLPAAFLPGDSLLILVGVLIAKGTMGFGMTICVLTTAASLGCWVGYIQGRWLGNTRLVQSGFLIFLRIIISARIICSINTAFRRCWLGVFLLSCVRCCR